MARTPRIVVQESTDEDTDALSGDREREANTLAETMDALRALSGSDTKVIVYKIPHANAKYEHCFDMFPPIDTSALMVDLRQRFGPGQYAARIMKAGKVHTTLHYAIAEELKSAPVVAPSGMGDSKDMFMMMMQMQQQASDRQMQMFMAMGQQQTSMMTAVFGALAGKPQDTPASMIAAMAGLKDLMPAQPGLLDDLEKVKLLREIFGGDGKGEGTPDNLVGLIASAAPHVMGALGKGVEAAKDIITARNGPAPHAITHQPAPGIVSAPAYNPSPIEDPILALVGPDMVFFAARGYSVDEASDILADKIADSGITQDALLTVVTRISAAGEQWLDALASEGVDLRAYPEWARDCLAQLYQKLNEPESDSESDGGTEDRREGGSANT